MFVWPYMLYKIQGFWIVCQLYKGGSWKSPLLKDEFGQTIATSDLPPQMVHNLAWIPWSDDLAGQWWKDDLKSYIAPGHERIDRADRVCTTPGLSRNIPFQKTSIAPDNGWLEYDRFLLGWPIFGCELLVSGTYKDLVFLCRKMVIKEKEEERKKDHLQGLKKYSQG